MIPTFLNHGHVAEWEVFFFVGPNPPHPSQLPTHTPSFHAPFHVVARILKMITSSAMETEVAAAFYNARDGLPFRVALEEMGHPQPPTPSKLTTKPPWVS